MKTQHKKPKLDPVHIAMERRKLKKEAILVKERKMPYREVEKSFKTWMNNSYSFMSKKKRKAMIDLYEKLFDKTIITSNEMLIIFD